MAISVSDLPPKYQAQILAKYQQKQANQEQKQRKYHNQPTERLTQNHAALKFDSQKEARRFDQLAAMEKAGAISDLRLQVDFTLQEAYTDSQGNRIRAIRYRADFTYRQGKELVVEDVKSKGTMTAVYAMKKKMLHEKLGLAIREV